MPTTPFSAAFEYNLKQAIQGGQLYILKQTEVFPQFFCCISGNTVGVAKDPVPIITVADIIICLGDNVTVDYSLSWSPTSSLAGTPWTLDYGDGHIVNGNFPNPRNPAAETDTYAGGYAATGLYTITFYVQDILGATSETSLQVYVVDCTAIPIELPFQLPYWSMDSERCIAAKSNDVFYTLNYGDAAPTWSGLDTATLTPTEIHDLVIQMSRWGDETLYVCDFNGIYAHPLPPDRGDWTSALQTADQIVNAAGISPAGKTTILYQLAISIERPGWQWVTWKARVTGGDGGWVGVAHTRDDWATIESSVVVDQIANDPSPVDPQIEIWGVCVDQHSDGATVYTASSKSTDNILAAQHHTYLWRSTDTGANWTMVDSQNGMRTTFPDVHVSYDDNRFIYWVTGSQLRGSRDGGLGWSKLDEWPPEHPWWTSTVRGVRSCPTDSFICNVWYTDKLFEWEYGVGLTRILDNTTAMYCTAIRGRDANGNVSEWLFEHGAGGAALREWQGPGPTVDKTGSWGAGTCYKIAEPEIGEFLPYAS